MNLYFRLLKVLLRLLLFPVRRIPLLGQTSLQMRVWPTDIDLNRHMNNGRYLMVMDLGRLDFLGRSGLLPIVWKARSVPVLGAVQVRYLRPLQPFQAFTLKTRILGWDGKWFYIEQIFESRGKVCTIAYLKGLFRSSTGNFPTKDLLSALGYKKPSPRLPQEARGLKP